MREHPVFDRVDLVVLMPDGSRSDVVVYFEDDLSAAMAQEFERAAAAGEHIVRVSR